MSKNINFYLFGFEFSSSVVYNGVYTYMEVSKMSQTLKRHNILFSDDEWEVIGDKAKELKVSVSEFIRKTMAKEIKERENGDLLAYINENCESVSPEEEEEINLMLKGIDDDDYSDTEEVSISDILQG